MKTKNKKKQKFKVSRRRRRIKKKRDKTKKPNMQIRPREREREDQNGGFAAVGLDASQPIRIRVIYNRGGGESTAKDARAVFGSRMQQKKRQKQLKIESESLLRPVARSTPTPSTECQTHYCCRRCCRRCGGGYRVFLPSFLFLCPPASQSEPRGKMEDDRFSWFFFYFF